MSNPFMQDMVTMKLPPGMGTQLSIAGFQIEADKQGCIVVPRQYVRDLLAQGLTEVKKAA